jgi:hypothetical protein
MHCKDTILRTQNNWPYSKLIPNSGTMENGLPVYKKELLETRNWDDKMYLYPIPQTEYYKNPNLGQNTGW